MEVLVSGDTHGNFYHICDLIKVAMMREITTIIVPGDFGYWEHVPEGVEFLDTLQAVLESMSIELIFLDGNHDNHPMLWERYGTMGPHVPVRRNIFYEPRGQAVTVAGVPMQFVGGAFSVDKTWRVQEMAKGEPEMWWKEEELTENQVTMACLAAGLTSPRVMFTHDAPDGCPMSQLSSMSLPPVVEARSQDNRIRIREIMEAAQPDHLFHGHFHRRVDYELRLSSGKIVYCHCIGADPDSMHIAVRDAEGELTGRGRKLFDDSYVILDLDRL